MTATQSDYRDPGKLPSEISELKGPPRERSFLTVPEGTKLLGVSDLINLKESSTGNSIKCEPVVVEYKGEVYLAVWTGKASIENYGRKASLTFTFVDGTEREVEVESAMSEPIVARSTTAGEKEIWNKGNEHYGAEDVDPLALTGVFSGLVGEVRVPPDLKSKPFVEPTLDFDDCRVDPLSSSGSGILDLTRESDDTSLGAELLEEIYTGEPQRDILSESGHFDIEREGDDTSLGIEFLEEIDTPRGNVAAADSASDSKPKAPVAEKSLLERMAGWFS